MSAADDDRFAFSLAGPDDEPEIRRLVGSVAMPGTLAVRFEREPDYFLGASVMGSTCDVLIARHRPDGELAGVLCRSERDVLVNGRIRRIGSIGGVRASPRFRGRWLMHRGVPLLRELGAEGLLYWAVIATDNPRARGVMVERRPPGGLAARRLAGVTTRGLLLRRGSGAWRRTRLPGGLEIGDASRDVDAVVAFLLRAGAARQLFPIWSTGDLLGGSTMRGLAPADIGVAIRGGRIVGTLAMWDQRAFKQDIVDGYQRGLRAAVRPWGVAARVLGAPPLPPVGTAIPSAFAALACVEGDDVAVMRALLEWVAERAAARGVGFLLLGLADGDPLAAAVGRWPRISYHADLFLVSWAEKPPGGDLDGRIPYVEVATL